MKDMQRIEWHDALAIGHEEIDAQHRQMVEAFNALHAAVYGGNVGEREDRMLDGLIEAAARNFRREEVLMEAHRADDGRFEVHRAIHRGMLLEVQTLRDRLFMQGGHLNAKALNFLRKWVYDHLTHSDRELVALIRCGDAAGVCRGACLSNTAELSESEGPEPQT